MENCPVCHAPLAAAICDICGFDASCHYESFPTLMPIPGGLKAVGPRRKDWETRQAMMFRCSSCGANTFYFLKTDQVQALECAKCGATHPLALRAEASAPAPKADTSNKSDPGDLAEKHTLLQRLVSSLNQTTGTAVSGIISQADQLAKSKPSAIAAPLTIPRQPVALSFRRVIVLRKDGTVFCSSNNIFSIPDNWTNIAALAAGKYTAFGIRKDGTVLSAGENNLGQCNTRGWTDIVSISASSNHTAGLRRDGTVVTAGRTGDEACNTGHWHNITAIATGYSKTVGLCKYGTVLSTDKYDHSLHHIEQWKEITAIDVGFSTVIGLRRDGTVVAAGVGIHADREIARWRDIISISIYHDDVIALRKDGTVVSTFPKKLLSSTPVDQWTDIIAVAAGKDHCVGLRSDGTVVATGKNGDKQCNVQSWTDIAAVYAGNGITVGVRKDGTLVTTLSYIQKDLDGITVRLD